MQVQFLNAHDFTIDPNGLLTRSGTWLLSTFEATGNISQAAEMWAGCIGEPWRIPNATGTDYTLDNRLKISKIECKALDSRHCQVKFTAAATGSSTELPGTDAIAGSFKFERKKDLTEYKIINAVCGF